MRTENRRLRGLGSLSRILNPGTGAILVTNYHVIQYAASAEARLDDGRTFFLGQVLAEDPSVDLAILWPMEMPPAGAALTWHPAPPPPVLAMAGQSLPPVGAKVYVVGSPQGLTNTLSEGLVSGHRDRKNQGKWLQITAPVSPGSSGGPVLDTSGKFVGVVTSTLVDGQNLNLAVPASAVARLLTSKWETRSMWKGASIKAEVDVADGDIQMELFKRFESQQGSSDKPDAFAVYVDAQVKAGDPLTLLYIALEDRNNKRYEKAIAALTLLTNSESCPHAYFAYYLLGCAYSYSWMQGAGPWPREDAWKAERKPAAAAFKKSTELNPAFAPAFYELSSSYRVLDLEPEALVAAEVLVRLVPRCANAYYERGQAYQHLKRYEAAVADYKTALDMKSHDVPFTANLYWLLGFAYRDCGEWQRAIAAYESVISLQPDSWQGCRAHVFLGDIYGDLGRYREALNEYLKAKPFSDKLTKAEVDQLDKKIRECTIKLRTQETVGDQTPRN